METRIRARDELLMQTENENFTKFSARNVRKEFYSVLLQVYFRDVLFIKGLITCVGQ